MMYVEGEKRSDNIKFKYYKLTVLFPKFLTRQLKYADFPTKAVTLFETFLSK